MVTAGQALPGRSQAMPVASRHHVLDAPMDDAFEGMELAMFGMGCFWGAERKFWGVPGVVSTAAGYAAGFTENPGYQEVCSGQTGHNEVVRVIFDPSQTTFEAMLKIFWESHDPTQGMQQGNDVGTQYRSGIYTYSEAQALVAKAAAAAFGTRLQQAGFGSVSTEIIDAPRFYFAEDYHQQYLHKNPGGYCGMGGTGVSCPVGIIGD
jgi:peptide-methionine (S)-S-oxide reductase